MKTYALTFALLVAGCGGNNGTGSDGGTDLSAAVDLAAPADLRPPQDMARSNADFSSVACGTAGYCTGGQQCCATQNGTTLMYQCATSCADGGIALSCDDPSQCSGGSGPFCCGNLTLGSGVPPNCPINGVSMCAAACPTQLPAGCPDTGQVKLCHHASDCATDTNDPFCCQYSLNGNTISFCVNSVFKAFSTMCWN
jgi:hypothetical protein